MDPAVKFWGGAKILAMTRFHFLCQQNDYGEKMLYFFLNFLEFFTNFGGLRTPSKLKEK